MKNLSIRVKITAWFSGIMAFIVAVTFGIIFWVSNSVTPKSIQDNLIEIVELNVDEIEFYEEKIIGKSFTATSILNIPTDIWK